MADLKRYNVRYTSLGYTMRASRHGAVVAPPCAPALSGPASQQGPLLQPEQPTTRGASNHETHTWNRYMKQAKEHAMVTLISPRVRKHRKGLRQAGMRPVQIWVPDTRGQQFTQECRRQCVLVVQADAADPEVSEVLATALDDLDGWHA